MKLSAIISAIAVTSAAAFSHSSNGMTMSANTDRRQALAKFAGVAAAAAPFVANADGAVSGASKGRARGMYGGRIAALAGAVAAGDFEAVVAEKSAFILFNSGAYPTTKDKAAKNAAISGTNAIFAAIRSKDKAALKSAYDAYVASNDISLLPAVDANKGQGYSSDFDYRVKTSAGAIYVR